MKDSSALVEGSKRLIKLLLTVKYLILLSASGSRSSLCPNPDSLLQPSQWITKLSILCLDLDLKARMLTSSDLTWQHQTSTPKMTWSTCKIWQTPSGSPSSSTTLHSTHLLLPCVLQRMPCRCLSSVELPRTSTNSTPKRSQKTIRPK